MQSHVPVLKPSLEEIIDADLEARRKAEQLIA
jgi:hypothetical protein